MSTQIDAKISAVIKDLELTYQSYDRRRKQISTLRGWSVILVLGYSGFLISAKSDDFLFLLPVAFALAMFAYSEAADRRVAHELREWMAGIEEIFMENDECVFFDSIQAYKFRYFQCVSENLSLGLRKRTWLNLKSLFASHYTFGILLWYVLLFIFIAVIILFFKYSLVPNA